MAESVLNFKIDAKGAVAGARVAAGAMKKIGLSAVRQTKRARDSFRNLQKSMLGLRSGFAGLAAVLGAGKIIKVADEWSLLSAQLKLVTKDSKDLAFVQEELLGLSIRTRVSVLDATKLYARIGRSTRDAGKSSAELLAITETLNQAVIVSGASTVEASAALIQFSQGLASNRLSGDELRSVLEQVPRIGQAIADGLGIPFGQLREEATRGGLTTIRVLKAIENQSEIIRKEFEKIPITVGQSLVVAGSYFGALINEINTTSAATDVLASIIIAISDVVTSELASAFEELNDGTTDFRTGVSNMVESVFSGIGKLADGLHVLSILWAGLKAGLLLIKSVMVDLMVFALKKWNGFIAIIRKTIAYTDALSSVFSSFGAALVSLNWSKFTSGVENATKTLSDKLIEITSDQEGFDFSFGESAKKASDDAIQALEGVREKMLAPLPSAGIAAIGDAIDAEFQSQIDAAEIRRAATQDVRPDNSGGFVATPVQRKASASIDDYVLKLKRQIEAVGRLDNTGQRFNVTQGVIAEKLKAAGEAANFTTAQLLKLVDTLSAKKITDKYESDAVKATRELQDLQDLVAANVGVSADVASAAMLDYKNRIFDARFALTALSSEEQFRRQLLESENTLLASEISLNRAKGFITERDAMFQMNKVIFNQIDALESNIKAWEDQDAALNAIKINDAKAKINDLTAELKTLGDEVADLVEGPFTQFFDDMYEGTKSVEEAFKDMVKSIFSEFNKLLAKDLGKQLAASIGIGVNNATGGGTSSSGGTLVDGLFGNLFGGGGGNLFGDLFGGGSSGGSDLSSVLSFEDAISGAFANGTNFAPGGLSLVGERGAEVVNLPRGSQVTPNKKIEFGSKMTVNNYFTVSGQTDARSQQQIAAAAYRGIVRANTRNA